MISDTLALVIFIVFFFACSFFVVTASALFISSRRKEKKKKQNKTVKGGDEAKKKFGKHYYGNYDGVKYKHKFQTGSKYTTPYYAISIKTKSNGSFKVIKENVFDRVFKRFGLSTEINTHDREFDDRFFIDTESVDFTREFFSDREKRSAVHKIFDKGFNRLVHNGHRMAAMIYPAKHKQILYEAGTRETVANLITLSKNIPAAKRKKKKTINSWKRKRFFVVGAILTVLMVTAMMTMLFGFMDYNTLEPLDVFWDSLKISLPLLLVFHFSLRWLLGGRSWPHRELIPLILTSFFIFIASGFGVELYLNCALDRAESQAYTVKVMDKYTEETENGRRYYAVVDSWREGEPMEAVKISSTNFSRLIPGESKIRFFVKPGKFNHPWLKGYKVVR